MLPVRSVGVQGDSRTYRAVLAIEDFPADMEEAAHLVNRSDGVNRVVVVVRASARPSLRMDEMRAHPAHLTAERLARLAPRRRHRPPSLARIRLRSPDLAVSGGADSVRNRRASGFRGAAADRFGGWNDGERACGCPRNCWTAWRGS